MLFLELQSTDEKLSKNVEALLLNIAFRQALCEQGTEADFFAVWVERVFWQNVL